MSSRRLRSTTELTFWAVGLALACGGRDGAGGDIRLRAATAAECANGGVVLVTEKRSSVVCDSNVAVPRDQEACDDTRDQIIRALEDLVESGAVDSDGRLWRRQHQRNRADTINGLRAFRTQSSTERYFSGVS